VPQLRVDERLSNTGHEDWECTWGHHLVLGPPFVAPGARFEPAAATIVTIPAMYEDTARLEPGQRSAWPDAKLRTRGTVDLREIPIPHRGAGTLRVTNPARPGAP
jgi:hypothetical protein